MSMSNNGLMMINMINIQTSSKPPTSSPMNTRGGERTNITMENIMTFPNG